MDPTDCGGRNDVLREGAWNGEPRRPVHKGVVCSNNLEAYEFHRTRASGRRTRRRVEVFLMMFEKVEKSREKSRTRGKVAENGKDAKRRGNAPNRPTVRKVQKVVKNHQNAVPVKNDLDGCRCALGLRQGPAEGESKTIPPVNDIFRCEPLLIKTLQANLYGSRALSTTR